jgi:RNA polymerase sigma-70 factor (ECF subfamily)
MEKTPERRDKSAGLSFCGMDVLVKEPQSECEISEEEISRLVRRAQEGESEAFGELFEILAGKLHRQALFLTGHEQQALDLLQETLIEVWKHAKRYDGRARFFTWICSVMVHRHYDWLRRLRVRTAALLGRAGAEQEMKFVPSPDESVDQVECVGLVRECLNELPAKQRTVVYLRFYAGESLEGIAAIAGCSVGTVKSRLFHGLERLARMRKLKEFQNKLQSETQK